MPTLVKARRLIAATALCLGAALPSWAQELVSVRNAGTPLQASPEANSEVLWKLQTGFPLQVLERKGNWLKVQDFEGDSGWVAGEATGSTAYHVVRVKAANLRAGPGTDHAKIGMANYGDVLRTSLRQGNWVEVQNPRGKGTAWIASSLIWGW